jgi:diguanylate cyclase (GGDEF)-like protein/PAS domain S-box-containing protein
MAFEGTGMRKRLMQMVHRIAHGGRTPQSAAIEIDFRAIAESSADVILQVGLDGVAQYASGASVRVFGYKPSEIVGRTAAEFIHPEDLPRVQHALASYRAGTSTGGTVEFRMRRKDGTLAWVEERAHVIKAQDHSAARAVVIVLRDISERKRLEQQLRDLANTDGLTGLMNRRHFDETLQQEWHRTLWSGREISLLLIDIDFFKSFNDQYGHQTGDDCLRAVGVAIASAVRQNIDHAARYGGEELAVIMPGASAAVAVEVAERLRIAIEGLDIPHAAIPAGRITISIGAATALSRAGGSMSMPEALISAADDALYKAKHDGRNRVSTALLIAPEKPLAPS